MQYVSSLILLFGWLVGVVIANGFWSTAAALVFPFWAWYLVAERLVVKFL